MKITKAKLSYFVATALFVVLVAVPSAYFGTRHALREIFLHTNPKPGSLEVEIVEIKWSPDEVVIFAKAIPKDRYTPDWPSLEVEFYNKDGKFIGESLINENIAISYPEIEYFTIRVKRTWEIEEWGKDVEIKLSVDDVDYSFH